MIYVDTPQSAFQLSVDTSGSSQELPIGRFRVCSSVDCLVQLTWSGSVFDQDTAWLLPANTIDKFNTNARRHIFNAITLSSSGTVYIVQLDTPSQL